MNDTDKLALLLERKVSILEDLALTERNSHECLALLSVEEVVGDVLELEVGCCASSNELIDRLALGEKDLWGEVDVASARGALVLLD